MGEGVRRAWVLLVILAVLPWMAGCGSDLGECDMAALVVPAAGPYEGQRLVHETCASGQCHAESAKGEARVGAPADLNFDLVPADTSQAEWDKVTRGETNVDELAEEMWTWIDDGSMPPAGQRMALTAVQKETVRNWLACGAPVNKQPLVVGGPEWAQIFPSLSGCAACHGATSPTGAWYGADACATRANLLASVAVGPSCGATGSMLIVPGNPDASLMLQKLESPMPCGTVMPPDRAPATPSAVAAPLRQWIAAGALAPGCP